MTLNYYDLKFSLFPVSLLINRMTLNYYDLKFLLFSASVSVNGMIQIIMT